MLLGERALLRRFARAPVGMQAQREGDVAPAEILAVDRAARMEAGLWSLLKRTALPIT